MDIVVPRIYVKQFSVTLWRNIMNQAQNQFDPNIGPWTLETISPTRAKQLLINRKDNKKRMSAMQENRRMKYFADLIKSGKWQIVPQGIVLGKDDALYDGAHRMGGIAMGDQSVQVWVYRDPTIETVHMLPIDLHRPRAMHFITGREEKLISVVKLCFRYHCGQGAGAANVSPEEHVILADAIEPHWKVLGFHEIPRREIVSSAPFQLSAIVHLVNGSASKQYLQEEIIKPFIEQETGKLPRFFYRWYDQFRKLSAKTEVSLSSKQEIGPLFRALTQRLRDSKKLSHDWKTQYNEFRQELRNAFSTAMPEIVQSKLTQGTEIIEVIVKDEPSIIKGPWENSEVDYLRALAGTTPAHEIAAILNRSYGAVRAKAFSINLSLAA